MSTPRPLSKAPIREAIFDFGFPRVSGIDGSVFEHLKPKLLPRFPNASPLYMLQGQFQFSQGKPEMKPTTRLVNGWTFNATTEAVQFRVDGFSYHQLEPYTSWDDLLRKFKEFWQVYRSVAKVEHVIRIGVRYINAFSMPWDQNSWNTQLMVPPPKCLSETSAKQFLTRVAYIDEATGIHSVVVQTLDKKNEETSIVLDINLAALSNEGWRLDDATIWTTLNSMREMKNQRFFDLLQEPLTRSFE